MTVFSLIILFELIAPGIEKWGALTGFIGQVAPNNGIDSFVSERSKGGDMKKFGQLLNLTMVYK